MSKEFDLAGVVPWGRTAEEYEAFLDLADVRPQARVLDCGGGPSSFTAEWAEAGRPVAAVDPLYVLDRTEIRAGFEAAVEPMRHGLEAARDRFVWSYYRSPEQVIALRRTALERFCTDREAAPTGRYIHGALPALPFADDAFDLVLCSHLLFLYSDRLDRAFHVAGLREMLRVAPEVRLFPLNDLDGAPSAHLEPVLAALAGEVEAARVPVGFEFQQGARDMLRVTRRGYSPASCNAASYSSAHWRSRS
ncbi:MAG: class I SAM-dependent methyltransferase [Alphaproteobacteria bacterium]